MKTLLLVVILGGMLAAALGIGGYVWWRMGDVAISGPGMLALAAGVVLSLALGIGLMALVFYSSRHGHDDDQYRGPGPAPRAGDPRSKDGGTGGPLGRD